MRASLALLTVAAMATSTCVDAWPQFLAMVPNSRSGDFGVVDLGHAGGTILRNPFGLAFNVGRNWTKELCQADSDGDGQTNGQELGDPCCAWKISNDAVLQRTTGTSNPGNASSLSDPSLWKDVDCALVASKAAADSIQSAAPTTAPSSASAPANVAGASAVLVMSTLALW